MPEEIIVPDQPITDTKTAVDPFASNSWVDTPSEAPKTEESKNNPPANVDNPKESVKTEDEFEYIDPNEWFKNEFKDYGWDAIEKAKNDIAEWRKAKENPVKEEIKFENDYSKQIYSYLKEGKIKELNKHLSLQEQLEILTTGDVTENNAESIIKTAIKNKNAAYEDADVERRFNKMFGLPKPPVQGADELDEDFKDRKDEWENQVREIKADRILEAKTLRPELEALKQKIVLPSIEPNTEVNSSKQLSPEEQARIDAINKRYEEYIDRDFKNFTGYDLKYKDEEVELPVSYKVNDEDLVSMRDEIKNFNLDEFILNRWFTDSGTPNATPNVKQIMEDINLLRKKDDIFQKLINETGTLMKKHYRQIKANINVNGHSKDVNPQIQNGQKVDPFKESSWSNSPVITNN